MTELKSLRSFRRGEIQRGIAVLALVFFFAGMCTFIADQMIVVAVKTTRPFGLFAQIVAFLAAVCGTAYGLFRIVRGLLRPALDEAASDIVSGPSLYAVGPDVAHLARWIGKMALCIVIFEVLLTLIQEVPPMPLVMIILAGSGLAYASLTFGQARGSARRADDGDREGMSAATTFHVYGHVLGYAVAGVFANMLLARSDLYLNVATIFGRAIESNRAEAVFVTGAVVIGLATSQLDRRRRWPLVVGLSIPLVVNMFGNPVLSIAFQFLGVTLVNRWMDQHYGSHKPMRQTVARSLEIEAALVAGSLVGRLFALLLLGTSGWSLGDVIGGLVTASLVTADE